jgi:glutamine amidotransferase-like uncharacterized protein
MPSCYTIRVRQFARPGRFVNMLRKLATWLVALTPPLATATLVAELPTSAAVERSSADSAALLALPMGDHPIRAAIYEGRGSVKESIGHVEAGFKLIPGAKLERLPAKEFAARDLSEFDLVIFSAGAASAQADDIGIEGRERVRKFVNDGGAYLGICAGAYLACAEFDWGLQLINAQTISDKWQRGVGKVQIELSPEGREAFGSVNAPLHVEYENGPVISPWKRKDLKPYRILATYTTEISENGAPPGIMVRSPAIAEAPYGAGRVMIFSPHPERTAGLEQMLPLAVIRLVEAPRD